MAKQSPETKVTRISASDLGTRKSAKTKVNKTAAAEQGSDLTRKRGFFGAFFGYFAGAWRELKQVRWPNRSATWGLTLAVLGFSAFFVVFILLLDIGFKYIFEQLLK